MKNLLNNVWADLRAKRLWPVAVLLLAGLVAVPVVLKKSAEEPPAASVAVVRKAPEPKELKGFATVQLEQNEIEGGSTLNTFDPSNPFSPPKSIVKNSEEPVPGDTTAPATADGETTPTDTGAGPPPAATTAQPATTAAPATTAPATRPTRPRSTRT